jgi:hypothetical protein
MKNLLAVCSLSLLFACPPASDLKCEPDSGPAAADAGEPDYEVQFRFVNLGRETVTVRLEGEDAGQPVPPLGSVAKTGHVTLIKQRGNVQARNFLADGGKESVTLPFEFDTTTGEPVTFLLQDMTPARISMNVTVPKQTQGATFGEKVNAGLVGVEIPGGVNTTGDCMADHSAPAGTLARIGLHDGPDEDCDGTADDDFVRPAEVDAEASPYFIRGSDGQLQVAWVGRMKAGLETAGGMLANGASRLAGGAIPGGAIVSSATRRLYVLNIHSARAPATVTINGVSVAKDVAPGALVRVKSNAIASAGRSGAAGIAGGAVAGIVVAGVTGTVVLGGDPCKPPYLCDFLTDEDTLLVVSDNLDSSVTVMKSRHDTALNSVGNVRRQIAFGTSSSIDTNACVALFAQDDSCVIGPARIRLAGGSAPAAQASYAATGRVLYPPDAPPAAGTPMRFRVEEIGIVSRRFDWANPPGLTPTAGKVPGGFAIVTSGLALDATAIDKRALFFVETGASPWTVESSLSR